jgi:hypothetical protein
MTDLDSADIDGLVRSDKVHRRVFTDADLVNCDAAHGIMSVPF